jgi:transposase
MEKSEKALNYSPELVAQIVADYDGGNGLSIKEIAAKYNRSTRSITGKLVNLGKYVKPEVVEKAPADTGPTKKEYLEVLKGLDFSEIALDGLKGATKPALAEVIAKFQAVKAA